jgi:hypothetical protein
MAVWVLRVDYGAHPFSVCMSATTPKVNNGARHGLPESSITSNWIHVEKFTQPLPLAHRRRQRDTDFGGVDDDSWETYSHMQLSAGTCFGCS